MADTCSFYSDDLSSYEGSLGLVVHPAIGAWKSLQNAWAKTKAEEQRMTRILDGMDDVKAASPEEINGVVAKFKGAGATTVERQNAYKKLAEDAIKKYQDLEAATESTTSSPLPSTSTPNPPEYSQEPTDGDDTFDRDMAEAMKVSVEESNRVVSTDDDVDLDATFEKDLELAKQLSLADK